MTTTKRESMTMKTKTHRLRTQRRAASAASVVAVVVGALLLASSALADRSYDSQITGFHDPTRVAFDSNDNLWIAAGASTGPLNFVNKYNAYPSQTLLAAADTFAPWSGDINSSTLAVDDASGELFLAAWGGCVVDILDQNGLFERQWNAITNTCTNARGALTVATDNSHTYSRGRVYLAFGGDADVEALDAAQRPVDFPATAPYINDNKLTGTPSGPFGSVGNIATDSAGNVYVVDAGNQVVDEFDSSGTFVRAFTGAGAPVGFDPVAIAVDPSNDDVLIESGGGQGGAGVIDEFDASGNYLNQLTTDPNGPLQLDGDLRLNSNGYLYLPALIPNTQGNTAVDIFTPNAVVPTLTYKPVSSPTTTSGTLNATIGPNNGGDVTTCHFEYGTDTSYGNSVPCNPDPSGSHFSSPTDVSADLSGLTTETTYHYRVIVTNANGTKYGADQTYTPHGVVGLRTDAATNLAADSATLNGTLVGDGTPTTYYFEWGSSTAYGNTTAIPPGTDIGSPSGPSATSLSFDLSGLDPYSTYHYRVVAINGSGTSYGDDQVFTTTPGAPSVGAQSASQVHSDRVLLHAQVNPNGADTKYDFEYVDDAQFQQSGFANAAKTSSDGVGMSKHFQSASRLVNGLTPGTLYHYRAVGTNQIGTGNGVEHTFTTFSFTTSLNDPCPNAHVRQQTGASLLLDCRAYELASAANAGGYDVESNLVPGQTPFGGYPDAQDQLLYGVHNGAIPGTGNPTNHGVDPYVATRGADGWSTKYVGIPANDPNASGPFASTLAGADQSLDTFAFNGPDICNPCFADGSKGIPVHMPDGSLTQSMAGSGNVTNPVSSGEVRKPLSADGSHLIFGSQQQFEPAGNPNDGNLTIYSRDLKSASTEVVSTDASGNALADGSNVAELNVSSNGSRTVIGDLVNTDSAGNRYYHLYLHVAGNPDSIDLTPGTPDGALYDGMSADGTKVYFTTKDVPTGASDGDTSADIYRADVSNSAATLTRVSTGSNGTGDTDSCDPAANTKHVRWNSVGSAPNCDVVAVGGGGGVASGDGSIYFLSPELLDGPSNGVQDAPNLYLARPGFAPHFISTLESSANAPLPPAKHPFLGTLGSFASPTGVAVDHANGDVYILDVSGGSGGTGSVQKFDSAGHLVTSFAANGTLDGSGSPTGVFQEFAGFGLPAEIAVDNDPTSPSFGDLYVPDVFNGVVDKFDSSGNYLSQISIGAPAGVAVDQANGNVYIPSFFGGTQVFDATGNPTAPTSIATPGFAAVTIAVDSSGNSYVTDGSKTEVYDSTGNDVKTLDSNPSYGVSVDPSNDHVYVDEGNRVVEFDSAGNQVGAAIGSGLLSGSVGLAADSGSLYVSNAGTGNAAAFGPAAIPPNPSTDNPLVIDSVSSAASRNTADFQVNPSGNDAVFTLTLPLTGYDNAAHREVFRYDAPSDQLDCASCNPTGEQATGEASLASNGSSLTDDGRVFFNSTEGLVDRDLNNKVDAYEWSNGKVELISTGTSPLDSSLLSVSADGTDAFFFIHDTLVPTDLNGSRVKVYDARAGGGFPQSPAPVPCQASDECHGAGTQPPAPPGINTLQGTLGNLVTSSTKTCKAGFVKKQATCVRSHRHKKHRKRHHKRAAANNHGGAK